MRSAFRRSPSFDSALPDAKNAKRMMPQPQTAGSDRVPTTAAANDPLVDSDRMRRAVTAKRIESRAPVSARASTSGRSVDYARDFMQPTPPLFLKAHRGAVSLRSPHS